MRFRAVLPIMIAAALAAGCEKSPPTSKGDPVGTVGSDGSRRVSIEAGRGGYKPNAIPARPGEKLVLIVTRTADGECLSQFKVADGPVVDLPMNQPVEFAVTAPASGKLRFACGMDMATGVIAVN